MTNGYEKGEKEISLWGLLVSEWQLPVLGLKHYSTVDIIWRGCKKQAAGEEAITLS
jgi:hypothetical protein